MDFSKKNHKQHQNNNNAVSKKLGFIIILMIGFMYNATGQNISSHAIGLRIGDNNGFGAEASYQHKLKDNKRLELDLGFRNNNNFSVWKLTGIHQWVWKIDGSFNWYAGFGAGIGNSEVKGVFTGSNKDDGFFLNANGNVGVEYDFDIPLLISIDFRPEFGIINDFGDDDLDLDIALSLRYQF